MKRRMFIALGSAALAAPHVRSARAETAIARGPDPAPQGPIGITDRVSGYRVDSIRAHSINGYWIRGTNDAFAIDAFWRIPEAKQALDAFPRITGLGTEQINSILITHPHTDHYGGLQTYRDASGNAPAFTTEAISRVIGNDEHGFYANRLEDMPGDIPPLIPVPDQGLIDSQAFVAADNRFEPTVLRGNEAIETALVYMPDDRVLFTADLVNNKTIPVLYQGSIDAWIDQLQRLPESYPDAEVIAPGHGAPGAFGTLVREELAYLTTFRALLQAELTRSGGAIQSDGVARVRRQIVDAFPDWRTSAGVPLRDRLIELNISWTLQGWRLSGTRSDGPRAFRPED